MKIAVQDHAAFVVISELLSPWNVSFTGLDEAEVVIVHKEKPPETKKTIVIPSDSTDFVTWVKDMRAKVERRVGERVYIAATSQTALTITTQMLYWYGGLVKSAPRELTPTEIAFNEHLLVLTLDVISEYDKILDETLNAKSSTVYRLLTGLPIPYGIAPKRLRDLVMKENVEQESLAFCDKLPMDALRFILVRAIEKLSGEKIQRKTWNGKRYACIVTHDVDTQEGLRRTLCLKKLEEKYDLPSAWYIPSKRYKLDIETIKELANYGEIGAHDTRHDGKLSELSERKLQERLKEAKQTLEKAIDCSIEGFRAPLLQHSHEIIQAVHEAGFTYDTSIPTWEPKHPYTMRPHGIGTVCPLTIDGVVEVPVALPQDHQMIEVSGLSSKQTVRKWIEMMNVIKELGGVCTILVHPEYELAHPENSRLYEELLSAFAIDGHVWVTTPTQVAGQWGSLKPSSLEFSS